MRFLAIITKKHFFSTHQCRTICLNALRRHVTANFLLFFLIFWALLPLTPSHAAPPTCCPHTRPYSLKATLLQRVPLWNMATQCHALDVKLKAFITALMFLMKHACFLCGLWCLIYVARRTQMSTLEAVEISLYPILGQSGISGPAVPERTRRCLALGRIT